MMKRYIVFPFLFMFLASCSNVVVKKNYPLRLPQKIVLKNSNIMQKKATQKPVSPVISHSPAQNVPSPVENAYINRHVSKKISQSKEIETVRAGKKIQLTLENIPLNKFIHLIFGKVLHLNYTVNTRVDKRTDSVTMQMDYPVSKTEFLNITKSILNNYGVYIENKEGMYFVSGRRRSAKEKTLFKYIFVGRTIPENIDGDEKVMQIIPFYYVNPLYYTNILRKLSLSNRAQIERMPNRNGMLIVTDRASNIRKALKIIDVIDNPSFVKKDVKLINLDYINSNDFKKELEKVLPAQGIPIAKRVGNTGILLANMPELNSILIISPKKSWYKTINFWKEKLDNPSTMGDKARLFVYYPKNRRAEELAGIVSKFGSEIINIKGKAVQKAGQFKIAVDKGRNALVIFATPMAYKDIRELLIRLDILAKQVLIEVTIAEVTLTKDLQYGVEWYLRHNGKLNGTLDTLGNLGIGSGGITYSVARNTGKFQALMNALAKRNLINVLSTPRIVVLDNKSANIQVGTDVPVVTSASSAAGLSNNGTTSILRTIEYRNTGVILHVKPTINSNGILTMDISQEVSNAQKNSISSSISSPLILKRSINTSVIVKSGETILLGGLISTETSKTVTKVPLLGDIPILGNLFKTVSKNKTKTELLIEVTPYIISTVSEASEITQKFKSLLDNIK